MSDYFFDFLYRSNYCCSTYEECRVNGSCALLREGFMCGRCKQEYQENFFSNLRCIQSNDCSSQYLFWLFFFLTLIVVISIYTHLQELISFIKNSYVSLKIKLSKVYYITPSNQVTMNQSESHPNGITINISAKLESPENEETESASVTESVIQGKEVSVKQWLCSYSSSINHLLIILLIAASYKDICTFCLLNESEICFSIFLKQKQTNKKYYWFQLTPSLCSFLDEEERSYTISGIISILISFYQVKSLLDV